MTKDEITDEEYRTWKDWLWLIIKAVLIGVVAFIIWIGLYEILYL